MKLKPSEYWRRQCKATFQFDPIGTKLVDDIGVETLMWGSDYPHTDGVWPESSKYQRRGRTTKPFVSWLCWKSSVLSVGTLATAASACRVL